MGRHLSIPMVRSLLIPPITIMGRLLWSLLLLLFLLSFIIQLDQLQYPSPGHRKHVYSHHSLPPISPLLIGLRILFQDWILLLFVVLFILPRTGVIVWTSNPFVWFIGWMDSRRGSKSVLHPWLPFFDDFVMYNRFNLPRFLDRRRKEAATLR